nr:zinc knuckle CX2CX4HX4C [Tanacetum cinerariifolium]
EDQAYVLLVFCNICYGLDTIGMERGFLSQKGSEVGKGVKEKQGSRVDKSVVDAFAAKEVVSPSVVNNNIEKENQSSLVYIIADSIHAISERFANTAYGFFLGKKVAYPVVANYVRNT